MQRYLTSGDLITVLSSGQIKLSYGSGRKADELAVSPPDVIEIGEPTKCDIKCDVHVSEHKPPRSVRQRMATPQTVRTCSHTFASLELPDLTDPMVNAIEDKLAERGADIKRRLRQEAERLKRG